MIFDGTTFDMVEARRYQGSICLPKSCMGASRPAAAITSRLSGAMPYSSTSHCTASLGNPLWFFLREKRSSDTIATIRPLS